MDTHQQDKLREEFLDAAGWSDAEFSPLAGDASTRSYLRLRRGDDRAVLMIAPPGAEEAPCPRDADQAKRRSLGYNAMARLAGPNLNAFVEVANALRAAGLSAPEIYAANAAAGLALIEDLGDDLFARAVHHEDEGMLYAHAVDALVALRNAEIEPVETSEYTLLDYDATALSAEASLLTEWYWPLKKDSPIDLELKAEYDEIWTTVLQSLSPPHIMVLRDFHAENLLWLPDRAGAKRVGLIDFQDALYGHAAYDLVSLLEDARRDVDADLAQAMIDLYTDQAKHIDSFDKAQFLNDYAILAAQRNAKILGIFARLAKRDHKPRYLDLLPRVEGHFRKDLARPALAPIASFFKRHMPDLAP